MLLSLVILTLLCTAITLIALALTDIKTRLLPNTLVLSLALFGLAFHIITNFAFGAYLEIIWGALLGGGLLYAIRCMGNYLYKQDTLGLGDVKLMAAGGLWLGPYDILLALTLGALAGLIHGAVSFSYDKIKYKNAPQLSTYALPAGPGFITGLVIGALAKFWSLPHLLFS